ncbi:MAG: ADP-ribosylation factor-like protein [Candidatus Hodarchaeota archaeon]
MKAMHIPLSSFQGKEISKTVCFVGLSNAGKTTLLHTLKGEFQVQTSATMGMNLETIRVGQSYFLAFDLGGQEPFAETFWQPFVSTSDGVLFVFDSADKGCVTEAGKWLDRVLGFLQENTLLMFLANKKDLEESMAIKEIVEIMNLSDILIRRPQYFRFFYISGLYNDGVDEAWDWFTDRVMSIKGPRERRRREIQA